MSSRATRNTKSTLASSRSTAIVHKVIMRSATCPHLAAILEPLLNRPPTPPLSAQDGLHQDPELEKANAFVIAYRALSSVAQLRRQCIIWSASLGAFAEPNVLLDRVPKPICNTCDDPWASASLHSCLTCTASFCRRSFHRAEEHDVLDESNHLMAHMQQNKEHAFALDLKHGCVYCSHCQDAVYSPRILEPIWHAEEDRAMRIVLGATATGPKRHASAPIDGTLRFVSEGSSDKHNSCNGLRGLRNLGSTCFMNAVLQAFLHNPLLSSFFLSAGHDTLRCKVGSGLIDGWCFACELDKLFFEVHFGRGHDPLGPTAILNAVWRSVAMTTELAGYAQQDAHEFFIAALDLIHAASFDCEGFAEDGTNCDCVIHRSFAGLLRSDVTCLRCGNVTTVTDPMLDISLELRNIGRKRKRPIGVVPPEEQISAFEKEAICLSDLPIECTLQECLDRFTAQEKLGARQYICGKCGNTQQEATKQMSVSRLPLILSFQLKRFEHTATASSKVETKVKFPSQLDMTPYTSAAALHNRACGEELPTMPSCAYSLFAVICHAGKMDTGHYTAFALHRGQWFYFDDDKIIISDIESVLNSNVYFAHQF